MSSTQGLMKAKDIVDLILLAAVWGASFLFMRMGAPEFGVIALVQLRMLIAALFLLPILYLRVGLKELPGNWRPLTMLGFYNSAFPFLLLTYSTLYVTAGFSSVINATAPLWGAVVAWLWLNVPPETMPRELPGSVASDPDRVLSEWWLDRDVYA